MNAILLTVLALSGASGGDYAESCDACAGGGPSAHHRGHHRHCFGPMPQSCYEPSLGCYASTRRMNRYPAFHGTYYRSAYNYRHYFDYPWHAGLHEPTSHFSYNVPERPFGETIEPPVPTPETAAASSLRTLRR